MNQGNTPTFVNSSRKEVIDIVLANTAANGLVRNWRVDGQHSFSDHQYILFIIDARPVTVIKHFLNKKRMNWDKHRLLLQSKVPDIASFKISSNNDIDKTVDLITQSCQYAATNSCPRSIPKGKSKPLWWTQEISCLRKETRRLFNLSKITGDWAEFRTSRTKFKKAIKTAKRDSWHSFTSDVEETAGVGRLRKILSSDPKMPSFIMKPDSSWTSSPKETLEILLDTHFPGSTNQSDHSLSSRNTNNEIVPKHINSETIKYAISTFDRFKSSGCDNVIPAEIQESTHILIPFLESIHNSCLNL